MLNPIGIFKSKQIEPYQAGRQPDPFSEPGEIHLTSGHNFEQALVGLESCSHIWIIYLFHLNQNWKPMVNTPRTSKKIGVFATRAPYRPNPIGLTCVPLVGIKNLTLHVGPNDLLDGTPVLDIKPYHPVSDVIHGAKIGWLDEPAMPRHVIKYSPLAAAQIHFLESASLAELKPFIARQLEYDPVNADKKRVRAKGALWELAYRTWRIDFFWADETITILSIHSGYTENELLKTEDKYGDKNLHRQFIKNYN